MPIICPHCTTSYAVDPASFGAAGRTVRCSRCKETWLAQPEEMAVAAVPAMAQAGDADAAAEWETALAREEGVEPQETPFVDSPPISGDWPAGGHIPAPDENRDWPQAGQHESSGGKGALRHLSRFLPSLKLPAFLRAGGKPIVSLPIGCAAMGALAVALMIWRADVVRLLPQTAAFYKLAGLEVNLRGLMFKDVKVTTETVEGKPVLVIEGVITGESRKPVEIPRLRFSVRDAQGAEIYAWNAVMDQSVLKPGERAWFKSRLASPPPEGRNIDIRFFNRRDIAGGNA
jgi:predicted Zn finger-like uncharacterized protein